MWTTSQFLCSLLALSSTPCIALAQQMPPLVALGAVRVESCAEASDAEYGFSAVKPIQIGGGPLYMNAREHRFLDALRGPDGQTLRVVGGIGSGPANLPGFGRTIIDTYTVTYEGHDQPISIFMDAYHFGHPRVPKGFTCATPLPTALRIPPIDPFKADPAMMALAIEEATSAFPPIPLDADGSSVHGVAFDQFRMRAFAAHAASAAGRPFAPDKPPADVRVGLVVLAYPASCDGQRVPAQRVEIVGEQGMPLQPDGPLVSDASELSALLPDVMIPPSSAAARYRLTGPRPKDQIRITYATPCAGPAQTVLLPLTVEPAKLITGAIAHMPPGSSEPDPTVYAQAVIDMEGRFRQVVVIGGPVSLAPAALESLEQWRARPAQVNGAPVVSPIVLQILFR
ncbi:MAG TPA: hypothetical protein VKB36_10925 [Vicinamibacterales bacterium]|nr:hypothetical protein [Vicinamibacterales bacterium]